MTVLASAEALFRTRGFAGTAVRDIAEHAQVSVGTVMSVGDKAALLVHVYERRIAAIHEELAASSASGQVKKAALVETVVRLFDPFLDYFAADPDLSRAYASIAVGSGGESSAMFGTLAAELKDEVRAVLKAAGADRPTKRAQAIYFGYIGMLMCTAAGSVDVGDMRQELELSVAASVGVL